MVAKKFGMCTTAFKKLCMRLGISKWPHRQLCGIKKKIASLQAKLKYSRKLLACEPSSNIPQPAQIGEGQ